MPNILIGGDLITSFSSQILLTPYSAGTTPFTFANPGSASQKYDEVHSVFRRIRYLDNATHSGLWSHTGVRETASSFVMQCNMKWDVRYPMENFTTLLQNKLGFQLLWTISNRNAPQSNYPTDIAQEMYYCPSVMLEMGEAITDVASKPPRLVEFNCTVQANAPAFFLPTDQAALNAFIAYIRTRGWSF